MSLDFSTALVHELHTLWAQWREGPHKKLTTDHFQCSESFCAGCQWRHQAVPVCNWQTAATVLESTFDGYLFKIIQMGLNPMVIITLV